MNKHIKFHKANGPAFTPGEQWIAGYTKCEVVSVRRYGDGKWDYEVTYRYENGEEHSKDAWNFQVRYTHSSDRYVK